MFKDDNLKFISYVLAIGVLIILTFCMMQVFILGGDIPFLNELGIGQGGSNKGEFSYEDPPQKIIKEDKDYQAIIKTNLGSFTIELYEENAPNTVNNFVFLSSEGFYDGVKVHRVLKDFLFQTGDRYTLTDNKTLYGTGGPGYVFSDEINWESLNLEASTLQSLAAAGYVSTPGLISKPLQKFSIAMANSGPNSNGSQFFIVTADNTDKKLDDIKGKYTVFGKVVDGFDTIESINSAEVDISNKNAPLPYKDIVISRIDIVELEKNL
ncbi:peptidylprolyl isomerase [Candidatus Dojkabacteria bacterium]|nr:peptidylprolyl isomerase [Candidatus Dojkabacteria bacterium]